MAVRKGGFIDFRAYQPVGVVNGAATYALVSTSATQVEAWTAGPYTLIAGQLGAAGTGLAPGQRALASSAAGGWDMPHAATNALGTEWAVGPVSDATAPYCFKVGTDPAFFVTATFSSATVASKLMVAVGFRTAGTISATQASWSIANLIAGSSTPYADIACVVAEGAACHTAFKTNSVAGTDTDSTTTETDATAVTYTVKVSGTGVTTGLKNGTQLATGGALGTLTSAIIVTPFFTAINAAGANAVTTIQSLSWGLL